MCRIPSRAKEDSMVHRIFVGYVIVMSLLQCTSVKLVSVTAPQAHNFALIDSRSIKTSLFLPLPLFQAPGSTFAWPFGEGGGANDGLGRWGRA